MNAPMEFRILGWMEVLDGPRAVDLPAGRGRALLALLAIHAGEAVPAERLIDELWGEAPPATASTVLQGLVSRLRRELEPGRHKGEAAGTLQTVGAAYRLAVDPDVVDAHRFKRLLDESRAANAVARSAILAEALDLWRGPALADFTYEPFAQRAITALDQLRLTAIEERLAADLSLGRHGEVATEAQQLVAEHPFRERLHELRMLALYRAGRQAEALEAYRSARATLIEEMAIEPGTALQNLERAILRHDPTLELEPRRAATPAMPHWLPRERRTVTVVAVDLGASTTAGTDPEAFARRRAEAIDTATRALRRHGARVDAAAGDMLLAVFGLPLAHEDDALRAVRAAVEMRDAVEALHAQSSVGSGVVFRPRAGIDTGDVVVGGGGQGRDAVASGPVVSAALRLQQAAAHDGVVLGAGAQRLVRGSVVLKPAGGIGVDGWRAVEVLSRETAEALHGSAAMFGRQTELSRLRSAFRRAVRTGVAYRCTVVGEAGIGKSTLAREFVESIGTDARVITGRCPSYGEGITFLPLREAVLDAVGQNGFAPVFAGEDDADALAHQVAETIGLEPVRTGGAQVFPAVRRLFELLAARRPLIIVLEDLHWAEPTLLDLLDFLTRSAAGPMLVLGLARPELLEERPDWTAAGPRSDALLLEPLPSRDIEELVSDRSGSALPADASLRIVETAQGNPLYAEQLLAAYADESLELIPVSLRGLLMVRLDRLGPGERDVLRCAAVAGVECADAALVALVPDEARPFLRRHVDTLMRKGLIARADGSSIRFNHVLVQLAAYQSMAREDRALLHERYATWLETGPAAVPPELDEVAGYHLEQAFDDARASGTIDDSPPDLGQRAGLRLAAASERALGRFDIAAAENLLSRARALLPAAHELRAVVTQRLAETDLVLGRFTQAQALLAELIDGAGKRGDATYERSARLERARIQFIVGPDPVPLSAIRREAEESSAAYAASGDDAGQCRSAFLRGCVQMRAGRMTAAAGAFEESLTFADRAGDAREELATRWMLATVLRLGPWPVGECVRRCEGLATARGSEHPGVMMELAMLHAMTGAFAEARALNERARTAFIERIRVRRMQMFLAQSTAIVELLAGDRGAAERELRVALDFANESEERDHISQCAARLASVVRANGRSEEAARYASLSTEAAPLDGAAAQALSKAAMARTASAAGDHGEADRLSRAAVDVAPEEMPNLCAEVLGDRAEILLVGGQAKAATETAREAARLFSAKGNTEQSALLDEL